MHKVLEVIINILIFMITQLSFTSEGDIWKVSVNGGLAQRLTTHPEEERYANISPDGKTLAYSASYEGPTEIYTMPIEWRNYYKVDL